MANEKIIAQKEQEVNELAAKIKDAKTIVSIVIINLVISRDFNFLPFIFRPILLFIVNQNPTTVKCFTIYK